MWHPPADENKHRTQWGQEADNHHDEHMRQTHMETHMTRNTIAGTLQAKQTLSGSAQHKSTVSDPRGYEHFKCLPWMINSKAMTLHRVHQTQQRCNQKHPWG